MKERHLQVASSFVKVGFRAKVYRSCMSIAYLEGCCPYVEKSFHLCLSGLASVE